MSSIKDQLLKLGLVDEQQTRRAEHQKRVSNKKKGSRGVAEDRRAREAQGGDARRVRQEADRAREQGREAGRLEHEAQGRVAQIVASGRIKGRTGGPGRFYFEARGERLPYLAANDETVTALGNGRYAIAESPMGEVTLVDAEAAARIRDIDDAWLRIWNRP